MVTRNEAADGSTDKRMAAADIVAGNAACDRTTDTALGQYGRGGETRNKCGGKHNFAAHRNLFPCVLIT
jgi:hypothetical protein